MKGEKKGFFYSYVTMRHVNRPKSNGDYYLLSPHKSLVYNIKLKKMVLDASLLNTQYYKVGINV